MWIRGANFLPLLSTRDVTEETLQTASGAMSERRGGVGAEKTLSLNDKSTSDVDEGGDTHGAWFSEVCKVESRVEPLPWSYILQEAIYLRLGLTHPMV